MEDELLEAALEVLRPLQRMRDGRGNTYCATCKQPDACHPDCKHGAVITAADNRSTNTREARRKEHRGHHG